MGTVDAQRVQSQTGHDDLTRRLIAAREEVARVQQAANQATRAAKADYLTVIAEARAKGLSLAQLAAALSVTRARAQQLVNEAKAAEGRA